MRTKITNRQLIGLSFIICQLSFSAALTSCSDFDDYNEVKGSSVASATQTLWQNISQDSRLSGFRSLLQKAGYGSHLDTTQYYTVWAPLDGTYDVSAYEGLSHKALLKQFVENHIARYSHNASGTINEPVMMLNGKSYTFNGSGNYTFDGRTVSTANLPNSNGVLHLIDGAATYFPTFYEFFDDDELSGSYGIDSLRAYYRRHEVTELDEQASVIGPIVDGMQTYIDSVMVTTNSLWDDLNARVQVEDSSYTFIIPTDEVWSAQYEKIKSCFNYIPVTRAQFFSNKGGTISIDANNPLEKKLNDPIQDAAFWSDSLANLSLVGNLIFSNTDMYNRWLKGTPSSFGSDTLRSTTYSKLSNPQDILAATVATVPMSNGEARIVNSYNILPWETYLPERIVSATNSRNQANVSSQGTYTRVEVVNPSADKVVLEDGATSFSYAWMEPTGQSIYVKPEMTLYLHNVLSATYDFYCVIVPENVDPLKAEAVTQPNLLNFTLSYCDTDGTLKEHVFLNEDSTHMAYMMETFKLKDTPANRNIIRSFENDTARVDTLYMGEFTFPVCYYGFDSNRPESTDNYCPNIKISTSFSPFTAALRNAYTRDLRIAAIILKPKELVEFESK